MRLSVPQTAVTVWFKYSASWFRDCGHCTHARSRYGRRAVRSDQLFVP
jgi:hypothetical protein